MSVCVAIKTCGGERGRVVVKAKTNLFFVEKKQKKVKSE